MSKNKFADASDQYEMLAAKLPEDPNEETVRVFRPDSSRPGLVEIFLPRHAIFEQYSECLARSGRPAEAQAIFDGLPSPQDDRDKAARALIQSMIYAGYATEKYTNNQDGTADEDSALRELASAKQLLPRDIGSRLLEASIYTERFRRTGDKAYEAAARFSLKPKPLSPQFVPVALPAALWTQGAMFEGIRPSRSTVAILRTMASFENRSWYLTHGDRVSAASVAGEGGDRSRQEHLCRSGLLAGSH